jgi:hypothetical protein
VTWNRAGAGAFAVHLQHCTEATMMSLKPLSAACAAAALIAVAGLTPARAQSASPDQLVTNGPQANVEAQSPNWSAQQNVIQSQRYDRLVETNGAFREARMRQECGPITDPQLHQSCIASFGQIEPSSAPVRPRHHRL